MIWLVGFVIAFLAFVIFESWRQGKKYRSSGRGQAADMMRAGMLEVQQLLQPERKVEMIRQQEDGEAMLVRFKKSETQGDSEKNGSSTRNPGDSSNQ